jgi:hypothetical protein
MKLVRLFLASCLFATVVFAERPDMPPARRSGSRAPALEEGVESKAFGSSPINVTNDAAPDFEPTVTRARKAGSTTTATVTVNIKALPGNVNKNYYVSKVGSSTYAGFLPLPQGSTWSVDPYLEPDQNNGGQSPRRLYCVGIATTADTTLNNKIVVWYSDDLGRHDWSAPAIIESSTTVSRESDLGLGWTERRTVDKPTIVVSGYSGTLGHVYVAYLRKMELYQSTIIQKRWFEVRIVRILRDSSTGGLSVGAPVQIWSNQNQTQGHGVQGAHVITSPGNGYVYVNWADFAPDAANGGKNRIMLARSPGAGVINGTWTVDTTGPSGYFFNGGFLNSTPSGTDPNGRVPAITVPIARYNFVANKIVIVWHEREASGSPRADVYYAEKGAGGWTVFPNGETKLRLSSEASGCSSTTDQFRPAIDFDVSGKMTIVYYDRQVDCPANKAFDTYFAQVDRFSTMVQGPTRLSSFLSNIASNGNWIGEYQDVWCDDIACYSAWVGTQNNQGDIFQATIQ